MREILFRGKRDACGKGNGDWVYGSLLYDPDLKLAQICGFDYYATDAGEQREPFDHKVFAKVIQETSYKLPKVWLRNYRIKE